MSSAIPPGTNPSSSNIIQPLTKFLVDGLGKSQNEKFHVGITEDYFHEYKITGYTTHSWDNVASLSFSENDLVCKVNLKNQTKIHFSLITAAKMFELRQVANQFKCVRDKIKDGSEKPAQLNRPFYIISPLADSFSEPAEDPVELPSVSSDDSCRTRSTYLYSSDNSSVNIPELATSEFCSPETVSQNEEQPMAVSQSDLQSSTESETETKSTAESKTKRKSSTDSKTKTKFQSGSTL